MTRIILLRAVNVGGARLPMAELRELATELGSREVSTYIASGNLVCTPPGDPEAFDRALEKAVQERFGFFREVISRTPEELAAALAAHPFRDADPDGVVNRETRAGDGRSGSDTLSGSSNYGSGASGRGTRTGDGGKQSYIHFLLTAPEPSAVRALAAVDFGDDRWQVIDRDVHLHYSVGAGTTRLTSAALVRHLGVQGTARNLATVAALIEFARRAEP